jgi:hypothetical protein
MRQTYLWIHGSGPTPQFPGSATHTLVPGLLAENSRIRIRIRETDVPMDPRIRIHTKNFMDPQHTAAWSTQRRARRRRGVPVGPGWTPADASSQRTSGLWTLCPAARAEQAQPGPFLTVRSRVADQEPIRIQGFNDQKL